MADTPKLLIPLKPKEEQVSSLPKKTRLVAEYMSVKNPALSKPIQTPELDAAVGNTPEFVAPSQEKPEDFVAPSQQPRQLTNEEQALEIMGLLNPVDFSPEAVAERNPVDENNVFNYAGRMFAGGAANSLRGMANDISYSAQTSIPQQTAAGAVAAYQAGEKFPEAEKAFQEYMDSIPQNQRAAMEITGTLPTFEQFLSEYVQKNTDIPELKKAVDWGEAYNKETAELYPEMQGSVIGDVAAGLGGVVPVIAASFVPGVGGFLSKAAMFSSARGNAMQQALDNGASFEDAEAYGTAIGGVELATGALFSGLGKIGKKVIGKGVVGEVVEKYIASQLANNPTAAKAISRVINGLGEGMEEYLAEWGGWMADKATIQQDERSAKDVFGDAGYSFFVGTLISGFMQASDLMARGQSAQEALETVTETETPEVDASEMLANGGQDPQRIPGTRSHANYILASPARMAQFEKETGVKLTGTKAEQRSTILEYYRNPQNTAPQETPEQQEPSNPLVDALAGTGNVATPVQEQGNPLADALLGEQAVDDSAVQGDVRRQLQPGDKLIGEDGSVVAEIKGVNEYGITYIDSDGEIDMVPFNHPDGESIYDALGASNGHFERPDGTRVGGNPVSAPAAPQSNPIVEELAPGQTVAQPSPAVTGARQALPPTVEETTDGATTAQPAQTPVDGRTEAPGSTQSTMEQTAPTDQDRAPKDSQTWETVKGAKITPDYMASLIDKEGQRGAFRFIPITNSETVQQAVKTIREKGWVKAYADWVAQVRSGQAGEQVTAVGALLYNNAVTAGDELLALDILADYHTMLRNTARGLQAGRIIKTLTPSSRLYMIQREVARLAEELKLPDGVTISQELQQEYLNAKTEAERDAVIKKMQKHVAQQIPSTFLDKWTALRYVNMLGNFKTQGRNILSNATMRVVAGFKNLIATTLEHIVYSKDSGKRTKSFTVSKELLSAAKNDFNAIRDIVLGEAKYSTNEAEGFMKGVEEERRIFKFMPLEAYRKLTNAAMKGGDALFSKSAYARALAGHLKANGIGAELFSKAINGEVEVDRATMDKIDKARAYAIQEAQEVTFRDNNMFSSWISKAGRRPDTPKAVKVLSEGIMPFRKTPANVLVRAEEYSPLGIVNTAVKAVQATKGTNDITGSDVINSLSKTLTGTGIFFLGMALRNAGWLTGGEDDEKQAAFDSLQGLQDYALSLPGDINITLDWVSPSSIPLFMGVQLADEINDNGFQWKDLEASLTSITDPLIQMSMLQGANDALDSIKYSDNNLVQIGMNAAVSYLTQGMTNSLVGQGERFAEDNRMETFRDKDSEIPTWIQTVLGKASAKIPGWDYNQVEYVDAWGRTTDYDNKAAHFFNQFFNPSYVSEERTTEVDAELQRLYDIGSPDTAGVFPTRRSQSEEISLHDEKGNITETRHLTAEEYERFNRTQGQTALKMVSDLIDSAEYEAMSDANKAAAIERVYDYAKAVATQEIDKNAPVDSWITKAQNADDTDAYLRVYSAYTYGSNETHRDYKALDNIMSAYGSMSEEDQKAISYGTNLDELYEAKQGGVNSEAWYRSRDAVSALKPVGDNKGVTTWQELEAVLSTASDKDMDVLLPQYMSGNYPQMYELAREKGFSAERFVEFYKALNTIEGDKYTSGKNAGKTIPGSKKKKLEAWAKENGWGTKWFNYMYKLTGSDSWELKAWDNGKW